MLDPYLLQFGMRLPTLGTYPEPTGYRMIIMPYAGPDKTVGGILLPDQVKDAQRFGAIAAYVLAQGYDCYSDRDKFPSGAWCKVGDWIMIGKYVGYKFLMEDTELRIINDDEIVAKVPRPDLVKRFTL